MGGHPLRSPRHRRLGGPLPRQLANVPHAHLYPINIWSHYNAVSWCYAVLISLSRGYPPDKGRLHTCYAPVRHSHEPESSIPSDLHVLGLPLAFILSQDQTLHCKMFCLYPDPITQNRNLIIIVSLYSILTVTSFQFWETLKGFLFHFQRRLISLSIPLRYMLLLKRTFRLGISLRLFYIRLPRLVSDFLICFPYLPIGSAKVIIFFYSPKKIFSFFWTRLALLPPRFRWLKLHSTAWLSAYSLLAFQFNPARCDWECKGRN